MRIRTLLLTTTLLATSALTAFADVSASKSVKNSPMKDFYAKVEGGLGMPTQLKVSGIDNNGKATKGKAKFNKGFVGGVGVGYTVNEFVRTDLMLQYRSLNLKSLAKQKVRTSSYGAMLNGYLTGHNDTIFTPYVMAGAGIGHNRTGKTNTSKNKAITTTNLIWNAGLGCQAKVHDNVSVDLGYRYVSLGKLANKKNIEEGTKLGKLASNEIVAGLVYNF